MLPLLIVCFLRPNDLEKMLKKQEGSNRKIYVFIDKAEDKRHDLNLQVISVAEKYKYHLNLEVKISDRNLGVGSAVPIAVNWISSHEDKFIVLEDDCHLNDDGFTFLENCIDLLTDDLVVISATSPWDLEDPDNDREANSVSSYPLISGWATNSRNWLKISRFIGAAPPISEALWRAANNPSRLPALGFFLAAHIRVFRKKTSAWDCSMALAMLIQDKKALIPNVTMVTNTGRDNVASHTIPQNGENSLFRKESDKHPSGYIDQTKKTQKITDKIIEKKLYKMKKRHVLSPLKSLIF